MTAGIKSCWILTEGIAGTENQCLGVAEALGLSPVVKRIKLKFPWKQLSPWLRFGHAHALAEGSDAIDGPCPDLLIASGRKSIGVALHIKRQSAGKTFLVQLQDPRINPRNFDLVVVPQHDPSRADNVIVTKAGLHRVTPQKIAEGAAAWDKEFSKMPHPRVAVLIGGTSKAHEMTADNARRLAQQLLAVIDHRQASLLITASRRTGETNVKILREMLCACPVSGPATPESAKHVYFWDNTGDNPYFGLLGHADYIIVTEDSVSMTSEALATGKPVYTASLEGGARRLDAFHRLLQEQGYTRPFTGVLETWSYTPPDDTMRVAREILERYKGRHK